MLMQKIYVYYHEALDNLIETINRQRPMSNPKDRDEEAKLRFLNETFVGA